MIIIQAISEPAKRETRRQALRLMAARDAGAVWVEGRGWVWAEDVRRDIRAAEAVVRQLKEGRADE